MKRPLRVYKMLHYLIEVILFGSATVLFGWSSEPLTWIGGAQMFLLIALEIVHEGQYFALKRELGKERDLA